MKITILISLLFSSFLLNAATLSLSWSHSSNGLLDNNSSPLIGSKTNPSVGYFAQLIYAGSGGVISNAVTTNSTGVSGNNQVVATAYIGSGTTIFVPADGNINVTSTVSAQNGDVFFVRLWNAVSPNFASGHAPTVFNTFDSQFQATHYGNTNTFTASNLDNLNTNFGTLLINSTSTLLAIPEPGTLATIAGGLAVVVFGLRRRRYRI